MKFKRIRIQNLLALRDATIEFDENGVHHVIGRNNVGKSALLNAINIILNNIPQVSVKDFLRDGTTTFKISAEFYDGNEVTLSRGKTDYYAWTLNGEAGRLDKTKGQVPEPLKRYFRLYTDTERTKECLNIRLPRDVLTFVDTTGSENDFLLQKALGTEEFILASQKADAKKREITSEQKQVRQFLERDRENVAAVEQELHTMYAQREERNQLVQLIEQEMDIYLRIEGIVQLAEQLNVIDEQVQALTHGIDLDRGEQLKDEIKTMEMLYQTVLLYNQLEQLNTDEEVLREQIALLDQVVQAAKAHQQVSTMRDIATRFVQEKHEVELAKQAVEQAHKTHMDFMVENKFCPIVMNSLDQRCPFNVAIAN